MLKRQIRPTLKISVALAAYSSLTDRPLNKGVIGRGQEWPPPKLSISRKRHTRSARKQMRKAFDHFLF